jgi:hypothetical protein
LGDFVLVNRHFCTWWDFSSNCSVRLYRTCLNIISYRWTVYDIIVCFLVLFNTGFYIVLVKNFYRDQPILCCLALFFEKNLQYMKKCYCFFKHSHIHIPTGSVCNCHWTRAKRRAKEISIPHIRKWFLNQYFLVSRKDYISTWYCQVTCTGYLQDIHILYNENQYCYNIIAWNIKEKIWNRLYFVQYKGAHCWLYKQ